MGPFHGKPNCEERYGSQQAVEYKRKKKDASK